MRRNRNVDRHPVHPRFRAVVRADAVPPFPSPGQGFIHRFAGTGCVTNHYRNTAIKLIAVIGVELIEQGTIVSGMFGQAGCLDVHTYITHQRTTRFHSKEGYLRVFRRLEGFILKGLHSGNYVDTHSGPGSDAHVLARCLLGRRRLLEPLSAIRPSFRDPVTD